MVKIPIGQVSLQIIPTEAIPTFIKTSQSQKDDANQKLAMSYTPLMVLLPPGWDCVTVYQNAV